MPELSDDDLLKALGVDTKPEPVKRYTRQEERIIAGFEDIFRFYEINGRLPTHGEDKDVFERLYAVRLERLRELPKAKELLAALDSYGLLTDSTDEAHPEPESLDDDSLLDSLGVRDEIDPITTLTHVRSNEARRAAEEIANRTACDDFALFKPLFDAVERELESGVRHAIRFGESPAINQGDFFILGGQIAYVAEVGKHIRTPNHALDARLRVIYSNGTESDLLMRSLQRALYKDETGRRLLYPESMPLFGDTFTDDDQESGTIYVLRSLSENDYVAENRELIHKIGVTGGKVQSRIAGAELDATFLLAKVEIAATYKLSNINPRKLESLLHRVFSAARLNLTIADRFGNPVKPQEWFLVPLHIIDEAVERIRDGSIVDLSYDPESVELVSLQQ